MCIRDSYHFKPDFMLDNLRSNNYICHLTLFSRRLMDAAGGPERMESVSYTHLEEAELIARLRSDLSLSRSHEQQLEKALGEVTGSKFWKMTWPMRYVVSKSRQLWHLSLIHIYVKNQKELRKILLK